MPNFTPATQLGRMGRTANLSSSVINSYSKINTDRQSRHEARERRRNGDWDILGIPTALLWLEDVCAAAVVDPYQALECEATAVTDLWP